MFYSHAFLARKSPLGTVWMAAHLESRIRKTHVANTDINSSIDYIMFPEVPIALRLSGHLLLGVVRIYSKKVEYLYHDCNDFASQMRTWFAPVHINLPEDANCAPFHSVTLPETFDLDALDVDVAGDLPKGDDTHVKAYCDITLPEQIPVEGVTYIPFFINEDSMDSPSLLGRRSLGNVPMEEETLPPFPTNISMEIFPEQRAGSPDLNSFGQGSRINGPSPNIDGAFGANPSPDSGVMLNFEAETVVPVAGEINQQEIFKDADMTMEDLSPANDRLPVLPELSLSPGLQNSPIPASPDSLTIRDNALSLGKPVDVPELPPSGHVIQKMKKKRKRNNLFDEDIVLKNKEIKKQLEEPKNLVRKRRKLPCSNLDVWKHHHRLQKNMFEVPSLSGMNRELKEICERRYSAPAANRIEPPEINLESPIEQPLFHGPTDGNLFDTMEAVSTESPRQMQPDQCANENFSLNVRDETMGTVNPVSPSTKLPVDDRPEWNLSEGPSPPELNATPLCSHGHVSASPGTRVLESNVPWTANTDYTETAAPQLDTSVGDVEDQLGTDMRLSEIPSLSRSQVADDLNFLEEESSIYGSEINTSNLASRTRAVAHYLNNQSPEVHKINESGYLSLNKILEGKKRRHCARMFFETLVLKSYNFIDVHQEEAYGDVTISLTSALSKLQS